MGIYMPNLELAEAEAPLTPVILCLLSLQCFGLSRSKALGISNNEKLLQHFNKL